MNLKNISHYFLSKNDKSDFSNSKSQLYIESVLEKLKIVLYFYCLNLILFKINLSFVYKLNLSFSAQRNNKFNAKLLYLSLLFIM